MTPKRDVAAELGAEAGDVGPDRVELGLHPTRPRYRPRVPSDRELRPV